MAEEKQREREIEEKRERERGEKRERVKDIDQKSSLFFPAITPHPASGFSLATGSS